MVTKKTQMDKKIEIIKKVRKNLLDSVANLSIDQLNEIPLGFNNNIAWNFGHIIAAQQGVCYKRANLNPVVEENYFNTYKPGTKPEQTINNTDFERIKELLFSSIDQFDTDYKKNLFAIYPTWTTSQAIEINSIDAAINFILFHDGLHIGYIMALKRIIKN